MSLSPVGMIIFMFSDLSSGPFPPGFTMDCKMKYSLNVTLTELYNGTKKEFTKARRTKKRKSF